MSIVKTPDTQIINTKILQLKPCLKPIILLPLLLSAATQAEDGFYLGSNVNSSTMSHTIERETGDRLIPSITTLTEETGYGFGVNAGYKFHVVENIYLAGELFYTDQDIETRNINNLLITELTLNNSYGFKAKLGFDINDKFSMYALLGQTTLDFDINNSYTFAPPLRDKTADVDELTIGIGAEYSINDHWAVTAEYSQLNDVSFDPIPEVAVPGQINDNELDFSSLTFGMKYSF